MELPDFKNSLVLNSAKERMGIASGVFGTIEIHIDPSRLTEIELERLTSPDGLDIDADDLRVLPDGTLAYKSSRVLLYIRDVAVFGNREVEPPKYHLADCKTLNEMRERRRFNRYVVSISVDGQFTLNLIDGRRTRNELVALRVCQNCLDFLKFDDFSLETWSRPKRVEYVSEFRLTEFFRRFPRSLHVELPTYNADNAPLNNYTADFPEISKRVKQAAGYRCQNSRCGIDLSALTHRKFLHVHHRNGQKSDNHATNLEVLCIRCHAEIGEHGHMQSHPDFGEFMSIFSNLIG